MAEQPESQGSQQYEQLVRLQAEFDNAKKRWQREQEELVQYAAGGLAKELLTVLDHFEEALKQMKDQSQIANRKSQIGQEDAGHSVVKGLDIIYQEFLAILQRHGLTKIETVGRPFDPHLHEAVGHREADDIPEHQIVEEIRAGYRWHDRVLRHAMVSVAKPHSQIANRKSHIEGEGGA